MKLRLAWERCCPSALRAGEAKRVPKNPLHEPVGYHLGCPYCARPQVIVSIAIDPDSGKVFNEEGEFGEIVTMTPAHTCSRCGRSFIIERSEFVDA